uniref:Uncharacterized protein n=1 Tax=Rhizophagus irregularis (strain DAOM 181602 / DAOM 197198 / MUCL 43194) TaxID=747089 RepID=U9UJS0_RHIID
MSNSFTTVCLIISKSLQKNYANGTAAYHFTPKLQNFLKYFDYKSFGNEANKNIKL